MQTFLHLSSLSFIAASFFISDPMDSKLLSLGALIIALTAFLVGEIRMLRIELEGNAWENT